MSRKPLEASHAAMYGSEPSFDYANVADIEFYNAKAFDWFNANLPSSKKRDCVVEAAKTLGFAANDVEALKSVDLTDILFFSAVYAKMVSCGAKLHPTKKDRLIAALKDYVAIGARKRAASGDGINASPSVQDFVQDRLAEFGAALNMEIDRFMTTGKDTFSFKTWCEENNVKAIYCDKIAQVLFRPLFTELAIAINGTDAQIAEGWSHVPKARLKDLAKFIFRMMEELEGRREVVVADRMPRVRKPKPPAKQVKNLKFKPTDATFKISSIPATKIVGATDLYVFNTKTRAMICFVANDAKGFSVKGSTLLGVDLTKSYSKTLRKPHETFPVVMKDGKRAIAKEMDSIKAVAKTVKPRINKDMVIMRAI